MGHQGRAHELKAEIPPARDRIIKRPTQQAVLLGFSLRRYRQFAALAQMGANRSELGFRRVLSGDRLDQAAADDCHGERQKRRIGYDRDHKIFGHGQDVKNL